MQPLACVTRFPVGKYDSMGFSAFSRLQVRCCIKGYRRAQIVCRHRLSGISKSYAAVLAPTMLLFVPRQHIFKGIHWFNLKQLQTTNAVSRFHRHAKNFSFIGTFIQFWHRCCCSYTWSTLRRCGKLSQSPSFAIAAELVSSHNTLVTATYLSY